MSYKREILGLADPHLLQVALEAIVLAIRPLNYQFIILKKFTEAKKRGHFYYVYLSSQCINILFYTL